MEYKTSFNGLEYYVSWRDRTTNELRFIHDPSRKHAIAEALFYMLRLNQADHVKYSLK